jgi:hypothetical protein
MSTYFLRLQLIYTFRIENPTIWLHAVTSTAIDDDKKHARQETRLWIETQFDRAWEIYLGVSFEDKTLKCYRLQHQWLEEEDEGYKLSLGGNNISWLTEIRCRCDCSDNYAVIVINLSKEEAKFMASI